MTELTEYKFVLSPENRTKHHTPGQIFDLLRLAFTFEGNEWEGFTKVNQYVLGLPMSSLQGPQHSGAYWCRDRLVDFLYEWIILGPYDLDRLWYLDRIKPHYKFWENLATWGFRHEAPNPERIFHTDLAAALTELGLDSLPAEPPRQAYLRLAKANHPDAGGTPTSFIKIKQAYDIVCLHLDKETI